MTTSTSIDGADLAPNHHADYPPLDGAGGFVAALTFLVSGGPGADLAVRLTEVGPGDDVLDVGCGPGVAVRRAAGAGASSAVGVDPAAVMLRLARVVSRLRRGRPPVRYLEGTAEELPLADGLASVLWSLATVHHWRDLTAGLAEARRVLRPSGRLLAVERRVRPGASGLASHGWTDDQARRFAEACTTAGFVDVEVGQHRAGQRPVLTVLARNGV